MGDHGTRTETSERLPDDITLFRRSSDCQINELERFLASMKAAELVLHAVSCSLNSFRSANLGLTPNIGNPYVTVEFGSQFCPLTARYGGPPINAEIRFAHGVSMLVRVPGQPHEGVSRGVIPKVIGREVFSCRRIEYPTRLVGQPEG